MKSASRSLLWLAAATGFASTMFSPVHGQEPATTGTTTLQEVVVTAQKRTEDVQNVPSSVSVLSGAKLEELGATQLTDFASYVPGFNVVQGGAPGQDMLILRGLSLPSPTALVGTYIDDTPVGSSFAWLQTSNHALDLLPYDFERIEVLNGPQGTLYGANAMGGLLKYVTRQPDLDNVTGRVGAGLKENQDGSEFGWNGRASVNVPIVVGKAALRVSLSDDFTPGFIDEPNQNRTNGNQAREQAGHAALLIKPSETWSVEVSALLQHTFSPEAATVTLTPSFTPVISPLSNSQRVPQSFESRLQYYSATANGDLGWANFVSASSYSLMRSLGSFQSYFPGDQITGLANQGPRIPLDKFTQEFRLVSPSSGRLQWLLGAFYTNEKGDQDQQVNALDSSNMPVANPQVNPELDIFIPTHYHEYALFANATWKFTDAFDLTGGARESRNEQSFAGIPTCSPALVGLLGGCPPVGATSSRQNVFNYAVSPSYHFSQDVMAYARVASGYRPGGPNTPLPGVPTSYKADTLVNYEIGIKTDWLDRKLRVDAAAYQIDWKDIQITEAGPPPTFFSYGANGNTATVRGFEMATTFAPVSSLHLGMNLAYSHAVLSSAMPSNSNLAGQSGDRLPYVPLWSGSLTADYKHALERGWTGALGAGWRYTGQRYTTINNSANCPLQCLGTPSVPSLASYGVLDMHAGVSNDLWNVSIIVRNLTNKYAWVDLSGGGGPPFDMSPIIATVLSARLITLSVDRRF